MQRTASEQRPHLEDKDMGLILNHTFCLEPKATQVSSAQGLHVSVADGQRSLSLRLKTRTKP